MLSRVLGQHRMTSTVDLDSRFVIGRGTSIYVHFIPTFQPPGSKIYVAILDFDSC